MSKLNFPFHGSIENVQELKKEIKEVLANNKSNEHNDVNKSNYHNDDEEFFSKPVKSEPLYDQYKDNDKTVFNQIENKVLMLNSLLQEPKLREKIKEAIGTTADDIKLLINETIDKTEPILVEFINKTGDVAVKTLPKILDDMIQIALNTAEEIPLLGIVIGMLRDVDNGIKAIGKTSKMAEEVIGIGIDIYNKNVRGIQTSFYEEPNNPVNNPVNNPDNNPDNNLVNNPDNNPVNNPVDNLVNNPVNNPIDNLVNNPVNNPVDNLVNNPVDNLVNNPVDNLVNNPVNNPIDNPVNNPINNIENSNNLIEHSSNIV